MIDTNHIAQIAQAAPAVQSALSAWNVVALGAGAFLTGVYHHIVAAGGVKTIARNLWGGPAPRSVLPAPNPPSTPHEQ